MKQGIFTVKSNRKIAVNTYEMTLCGEAGRGTKPGQFINIKIDGYFLRRPISVCDYTENSFTIIYKTVGAGTEKLSRTKAGETLDILYELGNGYDTSLSGSEPLLIGGGAGVPPMFALAKKLITEGKNVSVIAGFNSEDEVFYENEFKSIGVSLYITTVSDSSYEKGLVTDVMKRLSYTCFYACGPEKMLKAVSDIAKTSGQLSFEERMGCGFGACMGCTCKTKYGNKRICKDGPVLFKEEIIW